MTFIEKGENGKSIPFIFISHGVSRSERLVETLTVLIEKFDLVPVTYKNARPTPTLESEIDRLIRSSLAILGILTKDLKKNKGGDVKFHPSTKVVDEIRKARNLNKIIILFAEKDVTIPQDFKKHYIKKFSFKKRAQLLIDIVEALRKEHLLGLQGFA